MPEMTLRPLRADDAADVLAAFDSDPGMARQGTVTTIAEADAAGYLDEAIFVLWLDESLVPAYLVHRDAHRDRIETYISLYLAPAQRAP